MVPLGPHDHPPRPRFSERRLDPNRHRVSRAAVCAAALRNRRLEGALRVQIAHVCPDRAARATSAAAGGIFARDVGIGCAGVKTGPCAIYAPIR